eukprot:750918-Hanusia_phi.AAC.2
MSCSSSSSGSNNNDRSLLSDGCHRWGASLKHKSEAGPLIYRRAAFLNGPSDQPPGDSPGALVTAAAT